MTISLDNFKRLADQFTTGADQDSREAATEIDGIITKCYVGDYSAGEDYYTISSSVATALQEVFPALCKNGGNLVNEASRSYVNIKQQISVAAVKGKQLSTILLVAGVALAVLGIVLSAFGFLPAGIPLIGVALGAFYMGYNGYLAAKNLEQVARNPLPYLDKEALSHFTIALDQEELKTRLLEDTFMFGWAANLAVKIAQKKVAESGINQQIQILVSG